MILQRNRTLSRLPQVSLFSHVQQGHVISAHKSSILNFKNFVLLHAQFSIRPETTHGAAALTITDHLNNITHSRIAESQ